ncbi:MAG TPA: 30S ribosomal protein S8 [Candidatus Paceibacterota bacterium]
MYTDLLTRIKNSQAAKMEYVKVPFSNADFAIAELLAKRGYLESAAKKGRMPKRVIEIKLKYPDGKGAITGVKFKSKSSRRLYLGYRDLRPVKNSYGDSVISTSKGIMTGKEARKQKLGGEILFEIW